MKAYSVDTLLGLSLELEKHAQDVYQEWALTFATLTDVADFWCAYSADEAYHVRLLEELRERLSPAQRAATLQSELVTDVKRMLTTLKHAPAVKDLDEAYTTANMFEHSEVNPLFELLMDHFTEDRAAMERLHVKLESHIGKLIYQFPQRFSRPEQRREIKV